jgi:hypothetical protein
MGLAAEEIRRADAYYCIMVWILGSTEYKYKYVARD